MKLFHQILAVTLVSAVAFTIVTASAQQRDKDANDSSSSRHIQSAYSGLLTMAANSAVQKELGVSDEVATKLISVADDYRATQQKENEAAGIDMRDRQQRVNADQRAKTTAIYNRLHEEFGPKVKNLLSPDQFKRLKQIQIQLSGYRALIRADVAAELQLTDDQQRQVGDTAQELYVKTEELLQAGGDRRERAEKIRQLDTDRETKLLAMLTPEQQEKLNVLKGKPFDKTQWQRAERARVSKN